MITFLASHEVNVSREAKVTGMSSSDGYGGVEVLYCLQHDVFEVDVKQNRRRQTTLTNANCRLEDVSQVVIQQNCTASLSSRGVLLGIEFILFTILWFPKSFGRMVVVIVFRMTILRIFQFPDVESDAWAVL